MPFDQSTITEVFPPVISSGQVLISWTGTLTTQSYWWQVYVGRQLKWWGKVTHVSIPMPQSRVRLDIGMVGPGESQTDFSASLPAVPLDRADLTWYGGTFEDDDIQGYHVYGETTPGGGIVYTTPLADIPAYPGGVLTDGFGLGPFGYGGFGRSASQYEWTSLAMTSGTWHYGIKPYDTSGNEGPALTAAITMIVPPLPPAIDIFRRRLEYTWSIVTHEITLTWLASPG